MSKSRDGRADMLRLILAVRAGCLPKTLDVAGFHSMSQDDAISALENAELWIGPRPVLERNPEFRQIIPYIVLRQGADFVRYTRTASGREKRLHGRISVGLGGHIDLADVQAVGDQVNLQTTLDIAAKRELQEELGHLDVVRKEWVGLLVEHDNDVGQVHIGLVGLWTLAEKPAGDVEDAIADVEMSSIKELRTQKDRMETWSVHLLPWLTTRFGN